MTDPARPPAKAPRSRLAASRRPRAAAPTPAPDPDTSTRARILRAARDLIAERANAGITLVDVAARAGLSRQTLYLLFGSRAGLLLAMVDEIDRSPLGARRLAAVRGGAPARQAFEPYVRAWFDYLQVVLPVARALSAAAVTGDADAHAAWNSRMQKLRGGFRQLTQGLHQAGSLREGWTPETAADWIFALTHVDLWHHLVVEAGWKPAAAAECILATLRATIVKEG
jgi:AcrR family transcriptional regulator